MFRYPFQLAFGAAIRRPRSMAFPPSDCRTPSASLAPEDVRHWHADALGRGRGVVVAVGELDPERRPDALAGVFGERRGAGFPLGAWNDRYSGRSTDGPSTESWTGARRRRRWRWRSRALAAGAVTIRRRGVGRDRQRARRADCSRRCATDARWPTPSWRLPGRRGRGGALGDLHRHLAGARDGGAAAMLEELRASPRSR